MSRKTYSAREIVISLFPDTETELIPLPEPYRFEVVEDGLLSLTRDGTEVISLTPIAPAGNVSTQLCCDLCKWSASRHYLQLFRAEVPGSKGRRYRYVSLCRDTAGCEARRTGGDTPVKLLLSRVLGH